MTKTVHSCDLIAVVSPETFGTIGLLNGIEVTLLCTANLSHLNEREAYFSLNGSKRSTRSTRYKMIHTKKMQYICCLIPYVLNSLHCGWSVVSRCTKLSFLKMAGHFF